MRIHGPPSMTASCENALCDNTGMINSLGGGTESIGDAGTLVINSGIGANKLAA